MGVEPIQSSTVSQIALRLALIFALVQLVVVLVESGVICGEGHLQMDRLFTLNFYKIGQVFYYSLCTHLAPLAQLVRARC